MTFATIGAAIWDFCKKVPGWIWLVLAALVIGKAYLEAEKAAAIGRDREKTARKQAEVKAAVQERTAEIIHEERDIADAALEARDTGPLYSTFDELPESHKRILNRGQGSETGS